jgi:ribosomal protein L5
VGRGTGDKVIEHAADMEDHRSKAVVTTLATIAGFKVREGYWRQVTLRRDVMYEFLIVCLRDLPPASSATSRSECQVLPDGRGNYSIGVKEQIIFPGNRLRQIDVLLV